MTVNGARPFPICHCEEPARATPVLSEVPGFAKRPRSEAERGFGGEAEGSQSLYKKERDCFASLLRNKTGIVHVTSTGSSLIPSLEALC